MQERGTRTSARVGPSSSSRTSFIQSNGGIAQRFRQLVLVLPGYVECASQESVHEITMIIRRPWNYHLPHSPRLFIGNKSRSCIEGHVAR